MFRRLASSLRRRSTQPQQDQVTRAAVAPVLEQLERRQLMAVSPVTAGTKIKGVNLSENNISSNSTLITIPFSNNINLVDASKLRLFGYALNPLSSNLAQVKKTVNITKAEVLTLDADGDGDQDHSLLQITTDRLMRKGGTIIINEGALNDDNGDTVATQQRKTLKGQNKERFTLANRLFTVTDQTRFTNDLYAGANPASASTTVPEATATANLTAFLNKKVTAGILTQAKADAAIARYNSAAAKGTVPDHNLRAALFSLTGTFAESAIGAYLDGQNITGKPYTIIDFQTPDDTSVPVAQTSARPSDGRLRTIFKPEFKGEPFQALSAWLAHEALHQDSAIGLQEEEFSTIVETLVIAQQAQAEIAAGAKPVSTFLSSNTMLTNLENNKLAAMIQSGRTIFPYVGVLEAPKTVNASAGVFPGQKSVSGGVYKSWDDYVQRVYKARGAVSQNTAGNALLNSYYKALTNKDAPANLQFSTSLINDIDSFQGVLGTKLAIQMASALRMGLA